MNGKEITCRARVYGIVQGVGFRPTVSRHAAKSGVRGTVCNKGPYVEIFLQGTGEQVETFLTLLREKPPKRASIIKLETKQVETREHYPDFSIVESEKTRGDIFISPDIAICDTCKKELYDPTNRRYLHPFINCTCCGPRLTILDALPYDRERTSMKEFPMCPDCAREYRSPRSRRYDAQPVCCNDCGPEVYVVGGEERGRAAIVRARKTILEGGIVAVKGIGGFHLCCDAMNERAVSLLRERKRRPMKPFAVMLRDMKAVRRECFTDKTQRDILRGHQKPILLLDKKPGGRLAPSVAPGNPKVGVMLPYAPIQLLLFDYDDGLRLSDAFVMTSGNISGAPICRDDREAQEELGNLCDLILSHNRKIRIRADDSVMDFFEGKPYMIRRSRGYAPLPVPVRDDWQGEILAIGGELKNTFCIGSGGLFYPSPYVGDLADLRTVKALEETVRRMETLLEVHPSVVACDLHPRYNSVAVAERLGIPVLPVQHHYAHILSCMAENGWTEAVLGVSFDGTGYGTDGTIWGGELLRADLDGFTRLGCVRPFLQVGGDASAREGWRIAVSLLYGLTKDRERTIALCRELSLCDEQTARVQLMMAERKLNAMHSTSAGRLFDGVSALLGIRHSSTFEGEASTALEFAAEEWEKRNGGEALGTVPPFREEDGLLVLSTEELVRDIVRRRLAGEDAGRLAWRFHAVLAEQIIAACDALREQTGLNTAALSGGCYQNRFLLRLTVEGLRKLGFRVLTHSLIPPNDGGIALGQAVYSAARLNGTSGQVPGQV